MFVVRRRPAWLRPGGVTCAHRAPPSPVRSTAWGGLCSWLPLVTAHAVRAPAGVKSRTWYEGRLSDFVGLVGRADSGDLGALATIARSATAESRPAT